MNAVRECRRCGAVQPIEEFYVVRKTGGRRTWCRTCVKAHVSQWQKDNPHRLYPKQRRSNLKRLYGMTVADYDEMLARQDGRCAICRRDGLALLVDHCHASGVIRGLLCVSCNRALGQLQDSVDILERAAGYLDRHLSRHS